VIFDPSRFTIGVGPATTFQAKERPILFILSPGQANSTKRLKETRTPGPGPQKKDKRLPNPKNSNTQIVRFKKYLDDVGALL